MDHIFNAWDAEDTACSWEIHRRIGEYLHKTAQGRGILKSAFEHNVPILFPPSAIPSWASICAAQDRPAEG